MLQAHKEVDLAPHLVVGLEFKVSDEDQFPQALRLENLDPLLRVSKQAPCPAAILESEDGKRLVQLELSRILMFIKDVHLQV